MSEPLPYIPEQKNTSEGKINPVITPLHESTQEKRPRSTPLKDATVITAKDYRVSPDEHIDSERWTLKEKLLYGSLATLTLGGAIYGLAHLLKKRKADKEEYKSFEDGTEATIAKQIKMAFDNDDVWGTNTEALREALASVKSQEDWQKIITSYKTQYDGNLIHDLADELQSSEYNEMMQIINSKPEKRGGAIDMTRQYKAWAKRFKAAFEKSYWFLPGTDSDAVAVTLREIPTQQAFINTGVEFFKLTAKNLMNALKGEAEFGQYEEWMGIIAKKRKK